MHWFALGVRSNVTDFFISGWFYRCFAIFGFLHF